MGARQADADPRPPDLGRRLDRAQRASPASTSTGRRLSSPATPRRPARGSTTSTRSIRDDADHIIMWLAHRVQRPQEKINHALVLGGAQGIGKDTLLEPVKRAVGPWNFAEVSPQQMLGRFNGFRQIRDPAHQRSPRSRRHRPLRILRSYEGLHRRAARRAARRREAPARIQRAQLLRRHHHHQPQDRRHLSAGR